MVNQYSSYRSALRVLSLVFVVGVSAAFLSHGSEPRNKVVLPSTANADGDIAATIDVDAFKPYEGEQPKEALSEIFIPQVLPQEGVDDELLWVPQTDTVSFRPLCFCVSSGYYVNLLRVKGAGLLSRHRHPGPVHGHVLKGKWKYLEHDWVAEQGSYVFEPPGEGNASAGCVISG